MDSFPCASNVNQQDPSLHCSTLNRLIRLLQRGRGNQQYASLAQSKAAQRAIAITWLHLHSHESAHSASATYQSKPPKCVPHQASNLSWHATASPESTWYVKVSKVKGLRSVSILAADKEKKISGHGFYMRSIHCHLPQHVPFIYFLCL